MGLLKSYLTVWYRDLRRRSLLNDVIDVGFDGIELSLDYPLCIGLSVRDLPQVNEFINSGLGFGVHLPWREVFLASPLADIRKVSTEYVLRCLRDLAFLEPEYAVLHVISDQAYCMDSVSECIKFARESITSIARVCEDLGILLHVETTRNYCCSGLEHVVNYLAYGVRICLDIPHSIERYSKLYKRLLNLEEVIKEAPPQVLEAINTTHLHGYTVSGYRVIDSHLIPSKDLILKYLNIVRKGIIKPTYTVVESFYIEPGKHVEMQNLRWIVEDLKSIKAESS